jgi:hypothetical protein
MNDRFSPVLGDLRGARDLAPEDPRDRGPEPWRAFGPHGRNVAAYLELLPALAEAEEDKLADAYWTAETQVQRLRAAEDSVWGVVTPHDAGARALANELRRLYDGRDWDPEAYCAVEVVALALHSRDRIDPAVFDIVAGIWRSTMGPLPGDDA